jgi:hypothetical protein
VLQRGLADGSAGDLDILPAQRRRRFSPAVRLRRGAASGSIQIAHRIIAAAEHLHGADAWSRSRRSRTVELA